jgi:hypothetical protein
VRHDSYLRLCCEKIIGQTGFFATGGISQGRLSGVSGTQMNILNTILTGKNESALD